MFYSLRRYQYFQLQGQNQEQIKFLKKSLKNDNTKTNVANCNMK